MSVLFYASLVRQNQKGLKIRTWWDSKDVTKSWSGAIGSSTSSHTKHTTWNDYFPFNRPIYINWQKPKSVVPFTLPEKPITFHFFWQEKRMRENPRISYWFFGKWSACATSLYLWPYIVRSMSRAAGDSADWRSRPTWPKTRIIPVSGERAFTLAKNQWKTGGVKKKNTSEVGFSIRVFCSV